jgi:hypothetical protein
MPYKDPEKRRQSNRESIRRARAANPDRFVEYAKKRDPERVQEASARADKKRRENLTPEKKAERLKQQCEIQARWRREHPELAKERDRARALKYKLQEHGLTLEQFQALLTKQNGVCAICGSDNEGKRLAVDHDHATEKVRGLLCSPCNFMLGSARDQSSVLRNAANYLESPPFDGRIS